VGRRQLRASWLDPRLCGDAWIVGGADEAAFLMFNSYPLVRLQGTPFDVASLNQMVLRIRQRAPRRRCG